MLAVSRAEVTGRSTDVAAGVDTVKVGWCRNPMGGCEVVWRDAAAGTAAECWAESYPEWQGMDVLMVWRGRVMAAEECSRVRVRPGDRVVVCPEFGYETLVALAWYIAYAVIVAVVSYGIGLIFGPGAPKLPELELEDSNNYGFGERRNATRPGLPLPVVYGTVRSAPPVVAHHVTGQEYDAAVEVKQEVRDDVQFISIMYAVAGHELESLSDVKLNETPADSFPDLLQDTRLGTVDQEAVDFFNVGRSDITINESVSNDWVTKTTVNSDVEGLAVGFVWPRGLYTIQTSGKPRHNNVVVKIEYRAVGAGSWTDFGVGNVRETIIFNGFFQGAGDLRPGVYKFDAFHITPLRVSLRLDNLPADQYEVRMKFDSPPLAETTKSVNGTLWEYLQELTYDDFVYPGVALVAIRGMATANLNSSLPKMLCTMARGTVQVWTGAAYEAKDSGNPAWACYDVLHNADSLAVAVGDIVYAEFEAWADFCTANRLTVGVYLDTYTRVDQVLALVGACGMGRVVFRGGMFGALIDEKASRTNLFGMGNIVRGSFRLETLDRDVGKVDVVYFPASKGYVREEFSLVSGDFETVDVDGSERVELIGCTDFEQARRIGLLALNRLILSTEVVRFRAGLDAVQCRVNDVIGVQHEAPGTFGTGGRVVSATANGVVLDVAVRVTHDEDWKVVVRQVTDAALEERNVLNGSLVNSRYRWTASGVVTSGYYVELAAGGDPGLVEPVDVFEDDAAMTAGALPTLAAGEWVYGDVDSLGWSTVYVRLSDSADPDSKADDFVGMDFDSDALVITDGPWTTTPAADDVYWLGTVTGFVRDYRITNKTRHSDGTFEIEAVNYDAGVYDETAAFVVEAEPVRGKVSNLIGVGSFEVGDDGTGKNVARLSWRGDVLVYYVYGREPGGDWVRLGETTRQSWVQVDVGDRASADFTVSAEDGPDLVNFVAVDFSKFRRPDDVTNFSAVQNQDEVMLTWDAVADRDVEYYEVRQGGSWGEACTSIKVRTTELRWKIPFTGTYSFFVKAVDRSRLVSATAASATVAVDVDSYVSSATTATDNGSGGTADNMVYIAANTEMVMVSASFDDDTGISGLLDTDLTGYMGEYDLDAGYTIAAVDRGGVGDFYLAVDVDMAATFHAVTDVTLGDRTDLDYPSDTDTDVTAEVMCTTDIRVHDTDISLGTWQRYNRVAALSGRYYEARANFHADRRNTQITMNHIKHSGYTFVYP